MHACASGCVAIETCSIDTGWKVTLDDCNDGEGVDSVSLEKSYCTLIQGWRFLSNDIRDKGSVLLIKPVIGDHDIHSNNVVVIEVFDGMIPVIVIAFHPDILIGSILDIITWPTREPESSLAVHHDILIPVEDTTPTWFENDISAYPRLLLTINHAST